MASSHVMQYREMGEIIYFAISNRLDTQLRQRRIFIKHYIIIAHTIIIKCYYPGCGRGLQCARYISVRVLIIDIIFFFFFFFLNEKNIYIYTQNKRKNKSGMKGIRNTK